MDFKMFDEPKMIDPNEIMILDAEIKRAVPGEELVSGVDYCDGWTDFKGMGISVLCAHLVRGQSTHVFMDDNLDDLAWMMNQCKVVAGFNSKKFDEPLLDACWGIRVPSEKSYDFRHEIVKATGLDPLLKHYHGYSLERCCGANTGGIKNGHGALAPIWWQQGKYGRVIDYCLGDVDILVGLFKFMDTFLAGTPNFKDPVTGEYITVALP